MSRKKVTPILLAFVGIVTVASLIAVMLLHYASNQRVYYRASLLPSQQWQFGRARFMSYPLEQRVSPDGELYGVPKIVHYNLYNLGFVRVTAQKDEYPDGTAPQR